MIQARDGGSGFSGSEEVNGAEWKIEVPFMPAIARTMWMVLLGEVAMQDLKAAFREDQDEMSAWVKLTLRCVSSYLCGDCRLKGRTGDLVP